MNHYYAYLLRQIMERRELVSIFTDEQHPDEFLVGYLERIDSQHYLICEFTPWGEVDAYRVRRVSDVLSILYGEEYEERIKLMLEMNGRKIRRILPKDCTCEDGVLLTVFQYARERQDILSLIIGQDIFTGRVRDCNGLYVTMDLFDFFGRPDGSEVFELRSINVVQMKSGEEEMYRRLEEWQAELAKKETGGPVHENNHPDDIS